MSIFDKIIEDEELRTKVDEAHVEAIKIAKDDLETEFNNKLEQEVSGLKSKNDEILGEKKALKSKLEIYDGIDPEKAREAIELVEKNEDIQLIKDGKMDELLEKKTSQMRSDHESIVSELNSKLVETSEKASRYESLYNTKTVDDALREAAIEAKVRPEAITDVLLRGRNIFSVADDNSVEARDKEGKLRKTEDEKILTTKNWIEGLKVTSPHYWPASEGAGAFGGKGGSANMSDLDAAIHDAAAKGDMKTYRILKEKKAKAVS